MYKISVAKNVHTFIYDSLLPGSLLSSSCSRNLRVLNLTGTHNINQRKSSLTELQAALPNCTIIEE